MTHQDHRPHRPWQTTSFSEDGVEVPVDPAYVANEQMLPGSLLYGGEIVIMALKPSMWFLVFVSVRWLFAAAAVILLAPWFVKYYPAFSDALLTQTALLITAARLIVALLQWGSRLYVLTNRRVMCYRGVIQVSIFEASLVGIRNTYVRIKPIEKFANVGSIGFARQGAKHVSNWWDHVANPHEVHDRIRRALEKALDQHSPFD